MDVVSHWFMGSGATHGRTKFWVAGAMGVLPDLLVFIPNSFIVGDRPEIDENTVTADLGWYAWEAYQVTHSLVWMTIGFLFTWIFFEKRGVSRRLFTNDSLSSRDAAMWMWLPWLIHIINDIPTHTAAFFPTPFLAPFSDIQSTRAPLSLFHGSRILDTSEESFCLHLLNHLDEVKILQIRGQ